MKAPTRGLHQVETPSSGDIASAPLQTALLESVRFFQKWISPIDGPRCSFSPTCSRFGFEAVHDHGSLMGVIMTADRLMRCSYWPGPGPDYPRLANGSLYDPVVINLSKHP